MRAAGIVANHPAQGTPGMSCRIRSEGELVLLRCTAQGIKDNARLHACKPFLRVDLNDLVHVLGHVDDYCNVATLSCEAGSCATQEQRRIVTAARGHRLDDILYTPWDDDANWHLAIIGAIRCIERTAPSIEAHFTLKLATQFIRQPCNIDLEGLHA